MTATLIRELSRLLPHWSFVLLTSDIGHREASGLECDNVKCVCVEQVGLPTSANLVMRVRSRVGSVRRRLIRSHNRLRYAHSKIGEVAHKSGELAKDSDLLTGLGVDLLICPFGQFRMPQFHDPRIPTLSVIYDLQFLCYPQFFSPADVAARRKSYHDACNLSDALVCISEATRRTVLDSSTVDPEIVKTVYIRTLTAATDASPHRSTDILQRLKLETDRYFLYPANLWLHKNHETVIVAMQKLLRRHPDLNAKIVCTGAGLRRDQGLRARATGLGLGDNVLFTGYLPREDVDTLLLNCRGIIYPSLYEGFGIPLLEAMRAHKPIACSDVTSLPEVGGNAVLKFDPLRPGDIADALWRLATDDALCAQLVEAGNVRASEFGDSERMAHEYLEIMLGTLEGRRPKSTALHGVYSDGWTTGRILAMLGPREADGELLLKLSLPSWVPMDCIEIVHCSSYSPEQSTVRIAAGSSGEIRVRVASHPGWVELRILPTFCPAAHGMNDDARWLSAVCGGVSVLTDGVSNELAAPAVL